LESSAVTELSLKLAKRTKTEQIQEIEMDRYLTAGKGIKVNFLSDSNRRLYFSRPPVSTAHPLLRFLLYDG
jgi:hypothetical protein